MHHTQLALTYFNRAANYYRQAYYAQAIQHYRAGLKIDPTRAEVYADCAKAYEMVGDWDAGLSCLDVALRLYPNYPIALRRRTRLLEEKEIYESLMRDVHLDMTVPHSFGSQYQAGKSTGTRPTIEREFFYLSYEEAISVEMLWGTCQLIERTYHEVGCLFQHYPTHKISITIEDRTRTSTAQNPSLPPWAAASYDGNIRLTYSASGNPNFGILLVLIRHEWVHLLVDLVTRHHCPTWLDEGLAQILARPMMNSEKRNLQLAIQKGEILTFDAIQQPFSQIAQRQRPLAYLQSTAIAKYLIHQFGISNIRKLLRQIGDGVATSVAFYNTFGQTEKQILTAWELAISEG